MLSSHFSMYFPLINKTLIQDESCFYEWQVQQEMRRLRTTSIHEWLQTYRNSLTVALHIESHHITHHIKSH